MNTENKVFIVDEVMEQVIRIARKYMVFVDDKTDEKLLSNIIKEGVVLYE